MGRFRGKSAEGNTEKAIRLAEEGQRKGLGDSYEARKTIDWIAGKDPSRKDMRDVLTGKSRFITEDGSDISIVGDSAGIKGYGGASRKGGKKEAKYKYGSGRDAVAYKNLTDAQLDGFMQGQWGAVSNANVMTEGGESAGLGDYYGENLDVIKQDRIDYNNSLLQERRMAGMNSKAATKGVRNRRMGLASLIGAGEGGSLG